MEAMGIHIKVCDDPAYSDVEGFVLGGQDKAIIANWVRGEGIWHVDTARRPSVLSDFPEAAGHASAHSVIQTETPAGRLHALAPPPPPEQAGGLACLPRLVRAGGGHEGGAERWLRRRGGDRGDGHDRGSRLRPRLAATHRCAGGDDGRDAHPHDGRRGRAREYSRRGQGGCQLARGAWEASSSSTTRSTPPAGSRRPTPAAPLPSSHPITVLSGMTSKAASTFPSGSGAGHQPLVLYSI